MQGTIYSTQVDTNITSNVSYSSGHTPILASVLPTTKEAAAWLFSSYLERQKRSRSW